MSRRGKVLFLLAAALMLARTDFWWWDETFQPILFGWIDLANLYHIAIWAIGYVLVYFTVRLWGEEEGK